MRRSIPTRASLVLVLGLVLAGGGARRAAAQPLEVNVYPLTDLHFGTVFQNQGRVATAKTDPQIASFLIEARRANKAQRDLVVRVIAPDELSNGAGEHIPYEAGVAYRPYQDDPASATAAGSFEYFRVGSRRSRGSKFLKLYYYVFGALTIGGQPAGRYTGTITLQTVYFDL